MKAFPRVQNRSPTLCASSRPERRSSRSYAGGRLRTGAALDSFALEPGFSVAARFRASLPFPDFSSQDDAKNWNGRTSPILSAHRSDEHFRRRVYRGEVFRPIRSCREGAHG